MSARASVALLALMAYAPAFWWGAPMATAENRVASWGVDDETPLGPLAQVHEILAPKRDRNVGYALGHSFLVSAAYAPYLAGLWVGGQMRAPSPVYPYGLQDPARVLRVLSWIAHALSVALGCVAVVCMFDAAALAWGRATGWLAAAFALSAYPMFYYARTGNVDVPMLAFIGLGYATYARSLVRGLDARRAAWLGVWAGLALATKESALGAFLGVAVGLAIGGGLRRERSFWRACALGLGSGAIAFGIASGLLVDPERYLAHVAELTSRIALHGSGGAGSSAGFSFTVAGNLRLLGAMIDKTAQCMTAAGFALALLGCALTLRRDGHPAGKMMLPAAGFVASMLLLTRSSQLRYMLPAAFLLSPFAARAVTLAWERRSRLTFLLAPMAACALLLAGLRGASLTFAMLEDSRLEAARYLAARLAPGDLVGFFGASQTLPPLPETVRSTRFGEFYGMYRIPSLDEAAAQRLAEEVLAAGPRFLVVIPDHTSAGLPHTRALPPTFFEMLERGAIGYRRVAKFESRERLAVVRRPDLDYPSVNPPVRIYARDLPAPSPTREAH